MLSQLAGEPDTAFEVAIRGGLWEEAFLLAHTAGRQSLSVEAALRPALLTAQENLVERATSISREFVERTSRLLRLRKEYRSRIAEGNKFFLLCAKFT